MATQSAQSTCTLDGKEILKEGWLTVHKSRNPTFLTKQKSDKVLERAWTVIHAYSSKGPLMSFFQDSKKANRVLRREKLELMSVRLLTKMVDHPKHQNCFTLKVKNKRNRLLFVCDSSSDLQSWLTCVCEVLMVDYKLERVIWEFHDNDGLWQSLPRESSFIIESSYFEQKNIFGMGSSEEDMYQYNLGNMSRVLLKSKHSQRLKRTPFVWDKPETLHMKMKDLPAIWEWGDPSKDEWHPFERDTNIQIEEMYDCGSQWAELTLCIPSPMLLLLNLQDMKLVNSRTSTRYCLRRIDNSSNMTPDGGVTLDHCSSSDESDGQDDMHIGISPVSPLFQPLQSCLKHFQLPRSNVKFKRLLGEGAFGEVFLSDVTGLNGSGKVAELAVKQLRLSDFIARHGHHSQQMEDFLREAKEMAKVDHHRVVKLLAVCTLDFPLLLIEEYMNQGDLLCVLKEYRPSIPLELQLSLSWQVADGMNYLATELQCVHRDLAARNVMVNKDEKGEMTAKIADFGLSRHLYSEMYKHQGSKPRPLPAKWMALESLMYFVFSTRSDVWSYGVLLWEILTLGRTPYPGVENRELLEQIEEHGLKLSRPKSCPLVLYELILDCTQHTPEDRPTFLSLTEQLFKLHEQAKSGTLVHEVDSPVESEGSPANTAGPIESETNSDKKEDSSTTSDFVVIESEESCKTSEQSPVTKGGSPVTKGGSPVIKGGSPVAKDGSQVSEAGSPVTKGVSPGAECVPGSPVKSEAEESPVIIHSEAEQNGNSITLNGQSSEINIDEIKIIDASQDEDEKDAGHFYYVIDETPTLTPETPPHSPVTTPLDSAPTLPPDRPVKDGTS